MFDKSTAVYSPILAPVHRGATAVVVEGPLDALAVAAAAANAGRLQEFWPCSTNGVTVSAAQARLVASSGARRLVIALDGDAAGAEGTGRWVDAVCRGLRRPLLVTRLPEGVDPADWLAREGSAGLSAFDPTSPPANPVRPTQPGRELVDAALAAATDPVRDTIADLVPILLALPAGEAKALAQQAEAEMTRHGWNPRSAFAEALTMALAVEAAHRRHPAAPRSLAHDARPPHPSPPTLAGPAAYR